MPRHALVPLNDSQIRGFAPAPRPYDRRDGLVKGLILVVMPSGEKRWTLRYRHGGTQRRLLLGAFPGMTLAQARRAATDQRPALTNGRDVAAERRSAKAATTDTVAALAEEYLKRHAATKKKDLGAADERTLRVDVLPHWADRSVRDLTRRDVTRLLDKKAGDAPIMANRILAVVRTMLNFAVDHGWIDANPAARVQKPGKEVSRDRVLSHDEVRAVWELLGRFQTTSEKRAPGRKAATHNADGQPFCPISATLAAAFRFRIVTAQRGGEVIGMTWGEIDDATRMWTIPGARTKNGHAHRVPLTAEAVAILDAQRPAGKAAPKPHALVFVGTGESLTDRAKKASAAITKTLGIDDMRGHDFRRTAATRMAEAGVPQAHISRVLNHVDGGPRATAVYQRYEFDKEKRAALDVWARALDQILHPAETAPLEFTRRPPQSA